MVFSMQSDSRLYNGQQRRSRCPCQGGFKYLHCIPACHRRQPKGNPVPIGRIGPPCSWGIKIPGPGPPGWGSLKSETVKYGHESCDLDPRMTALMRPSSNCKWQTISHQTGRPTSTNPQLSYSNKNLVLGPRWGLTPRQTGRLIVGCNITLSHGTQNDRWVSFVGGSSLSGLVFSCNPFS
jgi:hypothetical protein